MSVSITIRDLVYAPRGQPVLRGLSAELPATGITALIGPNGAGKSVTLRLIDGLLAPTSGTIGFGGRHPRSVRRAFVFQTPGLLRASVATNVAIALGDLARPHRRARIASALERVGLAGRAGDSALRLSGGERQRLAMARAWAGAPDLLLLDEPTANLDPGATETIEALVVAMAAAGTKVLLVSHNLGQVARLAADVLVVADGRCVEHGPAEAVLTAPQTPEARAYLNRELPWTRFAPPPSGAAPSSA